MSFHRSANRAMFPSASGVRALIAISGSRVSTRSGYRCGKGPGPGHRRRSGQRQQVGERPAKRPPVGKHSGVVPVDDVVLLAEQQRPVAVGDGIGRGVAAACVDLPPGLERGCVDDPGAVKLLDLRHPAGQVGLVHRRLVLEDLFLHDQERRLVKAQITRRAPGQPPRCPPERRDQRPAHGIREHSQVPEAGVKCRADHGCQTSPLQVGVLE